MTDQALLASVFSALVEGVVVLDVEGRIVACNPAAGDLLGLPDDALIGRAWVDPTWQARAEDGTVLAGATHPASVALRTGADQDDVTLSLRTADGRDVWLRTRARALRDERGGLQGAVCTFLDVTDARRSAVAAQRLEARFRSLFELSIDMLCIADVDGHFVDVNPSFAAALGMPREQLNGARFLDLVHPDDVEATREVLGGLARGRPVVDFENRYRHADGRWRWISWRSAPPPEGSRRLYATATDVTERKAYEEALQQAASRDALTGLANRASMLETLRGWLGGDLDVAVAFLDLDGFKAVNDQLGHAEGDAVLVRVAEQLRGAVRGTDLVARWGGDEFVVVLRGVVDREVLLRIGTSLAHAAMEASASLPDLDVAASVGVSRARPGDQPEGLVARADRAMYRAKRAGAACMVDASA